MLYKLATAAEESWKGSAWMDTASVREAGGWEEAADRCMLVGISTSSPCGGKPAQYSAHSGGLAETEYAGRCNQRAHW